MRRLLSNRSVLAVALVATILIMVSIGERGQAQQDLPQGSRAAFMRQKLEFSKNLLEGLTVENYDQIEKNARALKKLSQAAEWEVPTIPNVEEYLPLTNEFQRFCDEIAKAAKKKNIDSATLGYVRLTTNCVHCHKYVREITK
jgi:hypothetical protein